jgi:hypothetical protein
MKFKAINMALLLHILLLTIRIKNDDKCVEERE